MKEEVAKVKEESHGDRIKKAADVWSREMFDHVDELREAYWAFSEEIRMKNYTTKWEQIDDIRKLSQLGLALHDAGTAYKSMTTARCI